jgi:hypothetical protein
MIFSFSGSGAGDKEPFVWIKLEALFIFFITTNVKRHGAGSVGSYNFFK